MADIRIRRFTKTSDGLAAHCAAIAALARDIWREHYTPIIGAAQVEYMLAKFQSPQHILEDMMERDYAYFLADIIGEDRPAGYCAVAPQGDYMLLSKLYVHRDFRGMGIARRFLDEAISLCRTEYALQRIRLTVNRHNHNSIAAYKKLGFAVVDSVKADIGGGFYMDDYVMELTTFGNAKC